MATKAAVPIFIMAGLTYFNDLEQGKPLDVKPLIAGGVAYIIADLFSQIPNADPIVTGIAWVALVAAIVVPAATGQPGIIQPLLNLANGKA